jgi:hypothetical protein
MAYPFRRHAVRSPLLRWGRLVGGWGVLALGLALTPTPLPFGVPLMLVAAVILAGESALVRAGLRRLRRGAPGVSRWLERHKARLPRDAQAVIDATSPTGGD